MYNENKYNVFISSCIYYATLRNSVAVTVSESKPVWWSNR